MLSGSDRKKPAMPLQETIRLYLALLGYNKQLFFFWLIFYSLVVGIPGAMGTFASIILIRPFSLIIFLMYLWQLLVALNVLTLMQISRRIIKQQTLPKISNYTSQQIGSTLLRVIGLIICPLLLPITLLLQANKSSQ